MPIMFTVSEVGHENLRSHWQEIHDEPAQKFKYCTRNLEDQVEFRGSLTLDEYSYPALRASVLQFRNKDQTLMRPKAQSSHDKTVRAERIVVDQIWIWQAEDQIICATLETRPRGGAFELHADIPLTSYGQIGINIADWVDSDDTDDILDRYQTAIVQLAEEVNEYTRGTGVESLGIDKERQFFHEINDIREELSMIRRLFSQQEEVWRDFASNAWPETWADCLNGRMNQQSDAKKQDEREITKIIMRPRSRIQKHQRRVAQLDEDAERVERSVGIQLDLKRQHTSLQEAHSTAVISAAAFGFAVITIVFTPLSFVMSLFALPIDRFQVNQIPSRWTSEAGMYPTMYIGTWAGKTLSLPDLTSANYYSNR